jgi:asparaginyl-tRNA synthetase
MKYCIDYCLKNIQDDMTYFEELYQNNKSKAKEGTFSSLIEYLKGIVNSQFKKISYTEAIEILLKEEAEQKYKFKTTPYWGIDLDSEHERYICENIVKGPVFIYNYPKEIKAFYMKLNDDKKTVQGTDCLLPFIGEIVGGSVREERLDVL